MTILPLNRHHEGPQTIIRVSDLRQWAYCPRVIWWTYVCPVGKMTSYKMKQGLAKEHRLQRLQRRRTLRAFGLPCGRVECSLSLFASEIGLSGTLDMLIHFGAYRLPVEVKFTRGPTRINHRLQLAGYALLLEHTFGVPVPHGYVVRLPDDTVDKVPIDGPLRELTWRTMEAVRRTLRDERMPPPIPHVARCVDCEYLRFCGDVDFSPALPRHP